MDKVSSFKLLLVLALLLKLNDGIIVHTYNLYTLSFFFGCVDVGYLAHNGKLVI